MKINCNIIEDLLPLYIDDMVSEDSRQLVEEHLKECAACRKMLDEMKKGRWRKVLFAGTGALLSPLSSQQGESIPSICHAVSIE